MGENKSSGAAETDQRDNPEHPSPHKQAAHPAQSHSPSECLQQEIPLPWAFQACGKDFRMQGSVRKELGRT